MNEDGLRDTNGCPDSNPDCLCSGPVQYCAWSGKRWRTEFAFSIAWCNDLCEQAHRAANPNAEHWKGWTDIADTMPGGPLDGIWEDGGLALGAKNGQEPTH